MNASTRKPVCRHTRLLLLPLALSALGACHGEPPALTVGDVEFSDSDLLTFNADRRTRLAEVTAFGLAVTRGETDLLGAPLIHRRETEALLETLERELVLEFAGVDEAALEARYQTNPDFELTVRHLVILVDEWASEEAAEEARIQAEDALARIRGGGDFAAVAAEASQEPGAAERGGLLEPGREGTWVEEFWEAAGALEVGEVSPVIRTPYGYHVLKLEDRSPIPFPEARHRVVEEVSDLIPSQGESIQAWTDSVTALLAVDTATLSTAWDATGSLFAFASEGRTGALAEVALARWPGGTYTGLQLGDLLVSLGRVEWEHVNQEGFPELIRVATDAARRSLLAGIARERGIRLHPREEEFLLADWNNSVASWASSLGIQEGMSPSALKPVALNAVTSSAQGFRITREQLHGLGPMLLSAYAIGPGTP